MTSRTQIAEGIFVSAQPSEPEIRSLREEGIRSIINLRTGETPTAIAPADEARLARQAGLAYVNVPFSRATARPQEIDRLRANLLSMPKPVLVHCRTGTRAAILALAVEAVEDGLNAQEAVARAQRMGIQIPRAEMEETLRAYVDSRRGTTGEDRTAAVRREGNDRPDTAPGGPQRRTKTA